MTELMPCSLIVQSASCCLYILAEPGVVVTDLAERQQALTATQQLAASQQQQIRLQQQVEQLQAEGAAAATQNAELHRELAAAQQAASGAAQGAQDAQQQLAEAQAALRAAELELQALRQELEAVQVAQAQAVEQVGSGWRDQLKQLGSCSSLSWAERRGLWHRKPSKGLVMSCGFQGCALSLAAALACRSLPIVAPKLLDLALCRQANWFCRSNSAGLQHTVRLIYLGSPSMHSQLWTPSMLASQVALLAASDATTVPSCSHLMCYLRVQLEDQLQLIASQREVHTSLQQHLSQLQMQLADEQATSATSSEQVSHPQYRCRCLPEIQTAPACPLLPASVAASCQADG